MSHKIMVQEQHGICSITLDNPECHNAFDDRLIELLTNTLVEQDSAPSTRVIILKANGKNFSAGADLKWMKRMAQYSEQENFDDSMALANLMRSLYHINKPTIAAIQGGVYGGGLGLVACCDMAIASQEAVFCLSEVKLGLIPAVISPYVINAIGAHQAKRYFLTGERFDAIRAQQMGLIHEIDVDPQAAAIKMAQKLIKNGAKAIQAAKKLVHDVSQRPINSDLIRHTAHEIATIRASNEAKEGIAAFLEKRPPRWHNSED